MANYCLLMLRSDSKSLRALAREQGAGEILSSLVHECRNIPSTHDVRVAEFESFQPLRGGAQAISPVPVLVGKTSDIGFLAGRYYDGRTVKMDVPSGYLACTFSDSHEAELERVTGATLKRTVASFIRRERDDRCCVLFNRFAAFYQTSNPMFQPLFLNGANEPQCIEIHKTQCRRPDDSASQWVYEPRNTYTYLEATSP